MAEPNTNLVMLGGVILLTSFMPVTAYSYYKFRLPKKLVQYSKFVDSFKLQKITLSAPLISDEYTLLDYAFPVAFVTFLCFLGSFSLLLGTESGIAHTPNLLLSGTHFKDLAYQKRSLLACTMGFMGAYVWSCQYIFRRFVTLDLSPAAFFSVGIRMIMAPLVALMFHYASAEKLYIVGDSEHMLPVVAFLVGMFPISALHYLREKTGIVFGVVTRRADPLPLDMIEGMNLMHKVRLSEVGIDNAQNLAMANLPELLLRTPFNLKKVIDWVGQAKLYIYFKDDIVKLRQARVRTIFDFMEIGGMEEELKKLTQETEIPESHLNMLYQLSKNDTDIQRLCQFKKALDIIITKNVETQ